jgi:hypothetical protein
MTKVRALDGELQAATDHLRTELAGVSTAAGLSAAFTTWLVALKRFGARGEALAEQLNLPACQAHGSATANFPA